MTVLKAKLFYLCLGLMLCVILFYTILSSQWKEIKIQDMEIQELKNQEMETEEMETQEMKKLEKEIQEMNNQQMRKLEMKNQEMEKQELKIQELTKEVVRLKGKKSTTTKPLQKNTSNELKYILVWTSPSNAPAVYMGKGRSHFQELKCPYTNCYVTSDSNYLGDITKFDVVLFSGPEVRFLSRERLPHKRSPKQKYVFATIESSHYYPVCGSHFNGFFNWTWTYRLDSEKHWGYIVVRDINGNLIGPKIDMQWPKMEEPIDDDLKEKLKTKTKAVAWFVSNCYSKSGREGVAKKIQEALSKYNYDVDIFGSCGNKRCPPENHDKCLAMIEKDYYFYLSFENSFSEDYVTEKLTTALAHNAVPIVYGYANYSRFMPDGIYLNAMKNSAEQIAASIVEAIENPEVYYNYFKWKKHLVYERTIEHVDGNEYCNFCQILNNRTAVETNSVYENFVEWWNTKYERTC